MIERVTALQAVQIGVGHDRRDPAPAPYQMVITDPERLETFTVALDQDAVNRLHAQLGELTGITVVKPKLVIPRGRR